MYAAATANPYANAATGLPANASFLPLTASLNSQTPLSTGNPLFDAYASQYAALYGAAAPVNGAAAVGTSADMTALQQASEYFVKGNQTILTKKGVGWDRNAYKSSLISLYSCSA